LDRSVNLAAAMDSRGYGRLAQRSVRRRRLTTALLLGSLVLGIIGLFAMLDATTSVGVGVAVIAAAIGCAVLGLRAAGQRSPRTRYRPDPWRSPEWVTAACGLIPAVAFITAGIAGVPGLSVIVDPLTWPTLPPVPTLAVSAAILPAWLTPRTPDSIPHDGQVRA
jgi:energy-coupling factor transport system permease protein